MSCHRPTRARITHRGLHETCANALLPLHAEFDYDTKNHPKLDHDAFHKLRAWLDSWSGIGDVAVGMAR
jgi:hypothetical protein